MAESAFALTADDDLPATLRRHLAGISALALLTVLLWLFGQGVQSFLPQLLRLKILIYMPQ